MSRLGTAPWSYTEARQEPRRWQSASLCMWARQDGIDVNPADVVHLPGQVAGRRHPRARDRACASHLLGLSVFIIGFRVSTSWKSNWRKLAEEIASTDAETFVVSAEDLTSQGWRVECAERLEKLVARSERGSRCRRLRETAVAASGIGVFAEGVRRKNKGEVLAICPRDARRG